MPKKKYKLTAKEFFFKQPSTDANSAVDNTKQKFMCWDLWKFAEAYHNYLTRKEAK